MERREFLTSMAAAGGLAAAPSLFGGAPGDEKPKLPRRALGRTGVEVTVFGLGGFIGMKEPRSATFDPVELCRAAFDAGVRYFDTAPSYNDGQSERNYGEALAGRRAEVFLATKTGERSYDGALREVEASLKRLRTDHVDLLQVHGARVGEDLAAWGKPGGVLKALEKLRGEKVTRFIGVTGHESAATMRQAITLYDFDTILTTFNPTLKRRPYQEEALPLAVKKKMGIIAMKVMGGMLGSLARGNPAKNDGAAHHDDAAGQAEAGELIRYVLGLPISVAIIGTGSIAQLRTNLAAAGEATPLDEEGRKRLEARMNGRPGAG
jgi:aryl-alcohol dehydrogenase-like predicted oxidoreductase